MAAITISSDKGNDLDRETAIKTSQRLGFALADSTLISSKIALQESKARELIPTLSPPLFNTQNQKIQH